MRIVKPITDNRFLNIKEVYDPAKHAKGYQFAERKGVDSVAFIGYDPDVGQYLLNKEYTPPTDEFLFRAFGGSIDKAKSHADIVKDEVKEEAGYTVSDSDIVPVGRAFVSTQMNQYCYLFLVILDKEAHTEREPENAMEAMATPTWMSEDALVQHDDWKAIAIMTKAKYQGVIKG